MRIRIHNTALNDIFAADGKVNRKKISLLVLSVLNLNMIFPQTSDTIQDPRGQKVPNPGGSKTVRPQQPRSLQNKPQYNDG
jgi:hypothetical protein